MEAGLFSLVFCVLNHMLYATERLRYLVDFSRTTVYYDPIITETDNVWEYYFHQPDEPCQEPVLRVVSWEYGHNNRADGLAMAPRVTDQDRQVISQCITRYLRPLGHINATIEAFYRQFLMGHHVIGVHFRGGGIHRSPSVGGFIPLERYFEEIDKLMATGQYDLVYLATDDEQVVRPFKQRYPTVTYPAIRTRNRLGIGEEELGSIRRWSKYKIGEDVIVEATLLSKANILIRRPSAVSFFSICNNPTLPYIDLAEDCLHYKCWPGLIPARPETVLF